MTDVPIESAEGREPDHDAQVTGIVEQTRADIALGSSGDTRALLEQRLKASGLELDADEIARLASDIDGTAGSDRAR